MWNMRFVVNGIAVMACLLQMTGTASARGSDAVSTSGGSAEDASAPVPSGKREVKSGDDAAASTTEAGALALTPTRMRHNPQIEYFVPGTRIQVSLKAKDGDGIAEVRCYFRAEGAKDYMFVKMEQVKRAALLESLDQLEGHVFRGALPAPSGDLTSFDYLFLVVDGKKEVVKSQVFKARAAKTGEKAPRWQRGVAAGGAVLVFTELQKASAEVDGFRDNIQADVVESAGRFAMVAEGVYIGSTAGAAGASGGGTVAASTSMLGPSAAVGAGVAAVAVVGVSASSSGGGGGGGGDEDGGSEDGPVERFAGTISGRWSGDGYSGTFTMSVSPDGNISGSFDGDASGGLSGSVSGSGSVRAAGGSASYSTSWTGRLRSNGDSLTSGSGSWSSDYGASGSWSGS